MARILVIDSLDGDRVRDTMQARRHSAVIAVSGAEGITALPIVDPHLVIMDHRLSDGSGLTMLLPRIGNLPLIVLSATDDQQTRVMALRAGADDFVAKPWDDDELVERVGAVLRRCYRPRMIGDSVTVGELVLDYGSVQVHGERLDLTKTEHLLLMSLIHQVGTVVPRDEVLVAVYGSVEQGEWHSVEVHLGRLRRKLLDAGVRSITIRTVGGGRGLTVDYDAHASLVEPVPIV